MALVSDIDLARLEPSVFVDAASAGLMLEEQADATVSAGVLTSAQSAFEESAGGAARVVVINDLVLESLGPSSDTELSVSRLRADDADAVIDPPAVAASAMHIVTFSIIIDEAERWVRRTLGLALESGDGGIDDDEVLNLEQIGALVTARAVALAFARASAAQPEDLSLASRAELYAQLERALTRQTVVLIDSDGDGGADAQRRMSVVVWRRA